MDEKELVKRIKNSFSAGMSRAQISQNLQGKNYRLAYIDELIKKAKRQKKILLVVSIILIFMLAIMTTFYTTVFYKQKHFLANPLEGMNINFNSAEFSNSSEVSINDIEITPEFISYLLNEIGAWQLHSNPTTLEKPMINFKIGEKTFTSTIGKKISTQEGLSTESDLQFNTNKEDLFKAMTSEVPEEIFKESLTAGRTKIEKIAGDTELFVKGYLKLYSELK